MQDTGENTEELPSMDYSTTEAPKIKTPLKNTYGQLQSGGLASHPLSFLLRNSNRLNTTNKMPYFKDTFNFTTESIRNAELSVSVPQQNSHSPLAQNTTQNSELSEKLDSNVTKNMTDDADNKYQAQRAATATCDTQVIIYYKILFL